jgi:hypothetical protein
VLQNTQEETDRQTDRYSVCRAVNKAVYCKDGGYNGPSSCLLCDSHTKHNAGRAIGLSRLLARQHEGTR